MILGMRADTLTLHMDQLSWVFVVCRVDSIVECFVLDVGDFGRWNEETSTDCALQVMFLRKLKTKHDGVTNKNFIHFCVCACM